ncbi:MAG: transglycosylase SLT domain-containing protein [Desulfobacterales bacterium]|nr:transglycosylase SLT domain-containing protein [Desulfobacterales bacterium]
MNKLLYLIIIFGFIFSFETSYCSESNDKEAIKSLLFRRPRIFPPIGKQNLKIILNWRRAYGEYTLEYDKNLIKYKHSKGLELKTSYQKLIEGWNKIINDGDLVMIYKMCKEEKIPFDIVFVAMTESHWNKNAFSLCGAKGYWQFITDTGEKYGLVCPNEDYRTDPVKSTQAAIDLLKDNYNLTYLWDRKYNLNSKKITNNDRWLWALWSYNRSPGIVSKYYFKLKGKTKDFAFCSDNVENSNYVNKIFGIREVLKDYVFEHDRNKKIPANTNFRKLLKEYKNKWYIVTLPERVKMLEEIKKQYVTKKKGDKDYVEMQNITNKILYIKQILSSINYKDKDELL